MNANHPLAIGKMGTWAPMYYLGDAKNVTIEGADYSVVSQTRDYSELRNKDGVTQKFTHAWLYIKNLEGKLKIARMDKELSDIKLKGSFADIDGSKALRALTYSEALDIFMLMEGKKNPQMAAKGWKRKVTLGHDCLVLLLPIIRDILMERWGKGRGGSRNENITLPAPRHFRRLYNLYIAYDCDPLALVGLQKGPGTRRANFHPADLAQWVKGAMRYCDLKRPTMRACLLMLEADIHEKNKERAAAGKRLYQMPSRSRFEGLIKGMGEYFLHASRFGEEAAKKKFAPTRNGMYAMAPGEIVEMDEWKVDLQARLVHAGIWNELSPGDRKAIRNARLWVTVAIDVATKCILAIRFSAKAPSSDSSLAALEMIVSHKEYISDAVEAGDPYIYSLVPNELRTDGGAAFRDVEFRKAVKALRCIHTIPPAGMPSARGTIESVFRTYGQKLLHYFEGRTFSSVEEREDYESEKRVVLNVDELSRLLTRAIIDIYHNEPHGGLAGETPANAWVRLSREYGMIEPLHPSDRRQIFGTRMTRKISERGVVFLGIHYTSPELMRVWAERAALPNSPSPEVEIRVDRFNLRTIAFHDGNEWIDVDAGLRLPGDVSVWEWVEAHKDLSLTHRKGAKLKLSVLLDGVNAQREAGIAAAARAELGTDAISVAAYRKVEKEYFGHDIVDDLFSAPDLAGLKVSHNPLHTGVEEFRYLALNQKEADAYLLPSEETPADDSGIGTSANDGSNYKIGFAEEF